MYCTNCGALLEAGHRYCPGCGQKALNVRHMRRHPDPNRPPLPLCAGSGDDGDEAVLFRKGHCCFLQERAPGSRVRLSSRTAIWSFTPSVLSRPSDLFRDIDAVADAFASVANTRFALRTKDGRYWVFSLNTVDIAIHQVVVERKRALADTAGTFDPYAAIY